jgi:hypothetical protein
MSWTGMGRPVRHRAIGGVRYQRTGRLQQPLEIPRMRRMQGICEYKANRFFSFDQRDAAISSDFDKAMYTGVPDVAYLVGLGPVDPELLCIKE